MNDLQMKHPKLSIKKLLTVLTVPLLFRYQPMIKIERRYLLLQSFLLPSTKIPEPWGICYRCPI